MEIIDYNNKLFKNIFPTYNDFKNYYTSTPLSDGDCPSEKTFAIIAFEYNDCHSCLSVESFKQRFSNDIYTYYKEFEATTKAIDDIMKLSDDDISIGNIFINNTADIPETESSTDVETADFISSQQKQISKKGKLQIKRELLSSKRAYTVKSFLKKFKHLFIKIVSPSYTFVVEEPDEE